MLKKILPIIIILLLAHTSNAGEIKQFHLDTPAPATNISFTDERNAVHNLTDYKGKVVVLNFWATWCEPCVHEIPSIANLAKAMEGKDVAILPVSIDYKGTEAIKSFYNEKNITGMPIYLDNKGKAFKEFKLQALPTTLVINKKNMIVAKVIGEIDWNSEDTQQYLLEMTKESGN